MSGAEKEKVIAVVGPTAAGKTSLGVKIAEAFGGEVVSADSMQVYSNMPIASAAPTAEEMENVPHHLVGFADPLHKFSVAEFIDLASETVRDISERGKLPIIVGGTGLYIDSLVSGVSFSEEDSGHVRQQLEAEADVRGMEYMLNELRSIDPKTAAKYHINDRKRILRALEIYRLHGRTKSQLDAESKQDGDRYECLWIGVTYRDRQLLYDRINRRVDIMLSQGLLEEARTAYESGVGSTAVQAIGHKEFFPYFKGEIPLIEAVENLKTETRRYAKRQMTWFRRNERINWIYADETPEVFSEAERIINTWL